jgi:transcription elongation factor Elf1
MIFNCPHCDHELDDLTHDAMNELRNYKYQNPSMVIEKKCPNCGDLIEFTVKNSRYLAINADGSEKTIGFD